MVRLSSAGDAVMPAPMMRVDPKLYEWCTVRQLEILEAINKHKGIRGAARALGMNKSQAGEAVRLVTRKAAVHGYSPQHDLTRPVAPGQALRGASTLYRRGEPEPVLQWVKTSADDEARDKIMRETVAALAEDCRGMAPMVPPPAHTMADLLAVYPLGDPHFGMYAWALEAGDDFDLKIARSLTLGAVDRRFGAVVVLRGEDDLFGDSP